MVKLAARFLVRKILPDVYIILLIALSVNLHTLFGGNAVDASAHPVSAYPRRQQLVLRARHGKGTHLLVWLDMFLNVLQRSHFHSKEDC